MCYVGHGSDQIPCHRVTYTLSSSKLFSPCCCSSTCCWLLQLDKLHIQLNRLHGRLADFQPLDFSWCSF